jgi:hypothetical protein
MDAPVFTCFVRLLAKYWMSKGNEQWTKKITPWAEFVDEMRGGGGYTAKQLQGVMISALSWLGRAPYVLYWTLNFSIDFFRFFYLVLLNT